MFGKSLFLGAAILTLSLGPALAEVKITAEKAVAIMTVKDMLKAGGQKLTAKEVMAELVNKPLVDALGTWTWNILPDGTQKSAAADKTWTDVGKWGMKGDQYCRKSAKAATFKCSDVYRIGDFYKFTDAKDKFPDWAARRAKK